MRFNYDILAKCRREISQPILQWLSWRNRWRNASADNSDVTGGAKFNSTAAIRPLGWPLSISFSISAGAKIPNLHEQVMFQCLRMCRFERLPGLRGSHSGVFSFGLSWSKKLENKTFWNNKENKSDRFCRRQMKWFETVCHGSRTRKRVKWKPNVIWLLYNILSIINTPKNNIRFCYPYFFDKEPTLFTPGSNLCLHYALR